MGFPSVKDAEKFEEICEAAEAARERAVKEAKVKRDRFLHSISHGSTPPSDRIKAAAEAWYAGKEKAAEEQCQAILRLAEQKLFEALDQLETRT